MYMTKVLSYSRRFRSALSCACCNNSHVIVTSLAIQRPLWLAVEMCLGAWMYSWAESLALSALAD